MLTFQAQIRNLCHLNVQVFFSKFNRSIVNRVMEQEIVQKTLN